MKLSESVPKPVRLAFKILFAVVALFFIVKAAVFIRQPILDNVICDPDVGGAAYSQQFFFQKGSVYKSAVETKPPLTYLLFHLLFRFFGKSMLTLGAFSIYYHIACSLTLFFIGLRLTGVVGGLVTAFIYSLYSAVSTANGLCYNFETWTLLPIALAYLTILISMTQKVQRKSLLFAGGALVAIAILFKQPAAVYAIAFATAILLETVRAPRNRKLASPLAALGLYAAGGLSVAAAVAAFFAAKGGLGAMLDALNPAHYAAYASSEDVAFLNKQFRETVGEFVESARLLLFVAFMGALPAPRGRDEPAEERPRGPYLLAAYAAATFPAVFSGSKFYDHYFMILIPLLAILAGRLVGRAFESERVHIALKPLILIAVAAVPFWDLRLEIDMARQTRDQAARTGRVFLTEDSEFFGRRTSVVRFSTFSHRTKDLGECIAAHSRPGDTIYVWDYIPHLYFYSGLNAPTRHFMYFEVATELPRGYGRWHSSEDRAVLDARAELMSDLERAKPINVVLFAPRRSDIPWAHLTDAAPMFPELRKFVESGYVPDPYCSDKYFIVMRRADRVSP